MKRIVNGVTYNTDTSSRLAQWEWEDKDLNGQVTEHGVDTLYQTRGGAFFLHKEKTINEWNESERQWDKRDRHEFVALSPDAAQNWLLEGDVEVFNNPFDDPPEATAEAEPGSTLYIRVPASLKRRVEEAAHDEKVSGNVWAMRCVERCLDGFPDDIAGIWHIARGLTGPWTGDGPDAKLDEYKLSKAIEALEEIGDLVEQFAKNRFGSDDLSKIGGGEPHDLEELRSRFQPYPK